MVDQPTSKEQQILSLPSEEKDSHLSFDIFRSKTGVIGLAAVLFAGTASYVSSNPDSAIDAYHTQYLAASGCLRSTPFSSYGSEITYDEDTDILTVSPKKIDGFLGSLIARHDPITFHVNKVPIKFPLLGFSLPAEEAVIGAPADETTAAWLKEYRCEDE